MTNSPWQRLYVWCVLICFASLALAASAQSQQPDQNPNPNAPVAIPPDMSGQPQPLVQSPPPDAWDRFWNIEKVSPDDDWTRHFRIGAIVGMNIKANFSVNGLFTLPGNNAANGIYDNGYVRTDNTGNAQGYTSYWGYNNASQLSGSTLTMNSTTSYSTSSSSEENGLAFPGFELAYGGNLWKWGDARIGWDFGFGLLPISVTSTQPMSASVNQNIYTFDTGGIVVPTAPYQGGPSGIGPTILANPTSTNSVNIPNGIITGSHTLDVILYTFRLGPTVYWDLSEDLGLSVSGGPALGLMAGTLKYNETITTTASSTVNQGQVYGTDVVYGGYVNATLTYHVERNGDLFIGAQYMPLGNASISGGGREGELKLGGQVYISAGINWTF